MYHKDWWDSFTVNTDPPPWCSNCLMILLGGIEQKPPCSRGKKMDFVCLTKAYIFAEKKKACLTKGKRLVCTSSVTR